MSEAIYKEALKKILKVTKDEEVLNIAKEALEPKTEREEHKYKNHGRGRCSRVFVVWKINMEENVNEIYAVAQNEKVALGIRQKFYDEAHKYGINPKHYISWREFPVVWSRSVFPDRYRIYDVDNKKIVWAPRRATVAKSTGEYEKFYYAKNRAVKLKSEGKIGNWVILKWNRQRKKWDTVAEGGKVSKLKNPHHFNYTRV